MPIHYDDELLGRLRAEPDNAAVLGLVESRSAHGDLGALVFRFARSTGNMRVVPVGPPDFPALVAATSDVDRIVVAAEGMRRLLIRAGDDLPFEARLDHEPAPDAGPGWWRVNPFDADVSRDDTVRELQQWFSAATRPRPGG